MKEDRLIIAYLLKKGPISRIKLHKIFSLLARARCVNWVFGNFSGTYDKNLDELINRMIVTNHIIPHNGLLCEGAELSNKKPAKKTMQILDKHYEMFKPLTDLESIALVNTDFEKEIIREIRIPLAMSMYRKESISSGKAAEIAGIDIQTFIEMWDSR